MNAYTYCKYIPWKMAAEKCGYRIILQSDMYLALNPQGFEAGRFEYRQKGGYLREAAPEGSEIWLSIQ